MSILFAFFAIMPTNPLRMRKYSPLITKCVKLKIIDALFMLTLITLTEPSHPQKVYEMNCILIIDIQSCVSEYYHLHSGALLPLDV